MRRSTHSPQMRGSNGGKKQHCGLEGSDSGRWRELLVIRTSTDFSFVLPASPSLVSVASRWRGSGGLSDLPSRLDKPSRRLARSETHCGIESLQIYAHSILELRHRTLLHTTPPILYCVILSLNMSHSELAASYAALILADEDIEITVSCPVHGAPC